MISSLITQPDRDERRRQQKREAARRFREKNKDRVLAQEKEYRAKNREKLALRRRQTYKKPTPEKIRENNLRALYGLSLQDEIKLLIQQGYRCAICKTHFDELKTHMRHIDHCHKTGIVRGILCGHCNCLLGHAKDNPQTLNAAITYLKKC